jgi:DNA-binding MarR family transcriptional regulator
MGSGCFGRLGKAFQLMRAYKKDPQVTAKVVGSQAAPARIMAKTCICFSARQAARAITQMYDEALRPAGIRSTQLALLNAIRLLGPVRVKRLASAVVIDRTTLTRNLRLLEKEGLVQIEPGKDLRERNVLLTAGGHTRLDRAYPLWEAAQAAVQDKMGRENLARLQEMLRTLTSSTRKT